MYRLAGLCALAALPDLAPSLTLMADITREGGFVALIAADGSTEKAWELANRSVKSLQDLLHAMPLVVSSADFPDRDR